MSRNVTRLRSVSLSASPWPVEAIISDAKNNSTLDTFRQPGNFSAHKIEYTCRREYIAPDIQEYRRCLWNSFTKLEYEFETVLKLSAALGPGLCPVDVC